MNKRAQMSEQLVNQAVFTIITVVFLGGMFWYVSAQGEGAVVWEDYWSKEIAKIINLGDAGQEVVLDVHAISKLAKKNGLEFSKMFAFNNEKREVCVQLNLGRRTCYAWFNDVKVKDYGVEYGKESNPINKLRFKIISGEENG